MQTLIDKLVNGHDLNMDEARQADRLVLMARGRVVGRGTEADIVGDARAVIVDTEDWSGAFAALDAAGQTATLAGRRLRVPGADPDHIAGILSAAGVPSSAVDTAATLEEAMVLAEEPAGARRRAGDAVPATPR